MLDSPSRLCRRDADAFMAVYDRCAERAYGVACALCGPGTCAEQAVEATFVSLWNRGQPRSVILDAEVMATVYLRALGSATTRSADADRTQNDTRSPHGFIETLDEPVLCAFVLAGYGHLTVTEIAGQLSVSSPAVKRLLHHALTQLAKPSTTEIRRGRSEPGRLRQRALAEPPTQPHDRPERASGR